MKTLEIAITAMAVLLAVVGCVSAVDTTVTAGVPDFKLITVPSTIALGTIQPGSSSTIQDQIYVKYNGANWGVDVSGLPMHQGSDVLSTPLTVGIYWTDNTWYDHILPAAGTPTALVGTASPGEYTQYLHFTQAVTWSDPSDPSYYTTVTFTLKPSI